MPTSPRPRRLHYWGIYIAQECTTRGLRCLHLHVQKHNSRCACRHVIRAWKEARVGLLARVQEDARVATSCARPRGCPRRHVIRASAYGARQRCPHWPRHPRVGLHSRRPKMAASKAVTGLENWSCCLHLSSHVLPHDEEQREEGVWL